MNHIDTLESWRNIQILSDCRAESPSEDSAIDTLADVTLGPSGELEKRVSVMCTRGQEMSIGSIR